jgi:hypothetical protein
MATPRLNRLKDEVGVAAPKKPHWVSSVRHSIARVVLYSNDLCCTTFWSRCRPLVREFYLSLHPEKCPACSCRFGISQRLAHSVLFFTRDEIVIGEPCSALIEQEETSASSQAVRKCQTKVCRCMFSPFPVGTKITDGLPGCRQASCSKVHVQRRALPDLERQNKSMHKV